MALVESCGELDLRGAAGSDSGRQGVAVRWLFTATVFLSAALLFLVQPLFARLALPLLGGSPGVWNTALVFFQAVLLLGYAYSHFTTRWLGLRRQAVLHCGLLLLPLLTLPIALPVGARPPAEGNPTLWLLGVMGSSVGAAFLAVSTSGPLLQRWFAASDAGAGRNPYALYAASNLGSMLALAAYPFLLEPHLRLAEQSRLWSVGYGLLAGLVFLCSLAVLRAGARQQVGSGRTVGADTDPPMEKAAVPPRAAQRARWVLLALIPSSLMAGVTTYLSTDIAAIPLLWLLPLSLYLLTFILAFADRPVVRRPIVSRAIAVLTVAVALVLALRASEPVALLVAVHLAAFFALALGLHLALAEERPPAENLTEFYLWVSVGGVLGGGFNALVAPILFSGVFEYPLMIALGCMLGGAHTPTRGSRQAALDWVLPLVLGSATLALGRAVQAWVALPDSVVRALTVGVPVLVCYGFSQRPVRFGLGVGALFLATSMLHTGLRQGVVAERSFFGVHRTFVSAEGRFRNLMHGSTLHGCQSLEPARRQEPLTYYTRSGPLGQLFHALPARPGRRVAAVGLGVGSVAAYGRRGEEWTFYEIDPVVRRLAADPALFTFLTDSKASVRVELGDARLSLAAAPLVYDLMILDAYSSDSVPLHLLTRDALQLYLERLAPGGLLAFHISNRHLDLEPVLGNLIQDAGLSALVQHDVEVSDAEKKVGKEPSEWLVVARHPEGLAALARDERWTLPRLDPSVGIWTDDYASVLRVLHWR